jgi:glycosyltransferase involved in cell wall biosynthesis
MRICLYTETALPTIGGQELVVDALAREYTNQGHDVVVLAPTPRRGSVANDRRLPYRVIRHRRFLSTRRLIEWYQYSLLKLHRKFPFEVLHCHSVHPCGYLGALCKDRLQAALVLTSHGGDIREGGARILKPGARSRAITALRRADAVVSIGPFTTQALRRLEPSTRMIVEIPNGVDLTPFDNPPFRPHSARPPELDPRIRTGRYVLFLGRLHRRKGVDVLLEAWAASLAKTDSGMMLAIAGDGADRDALANQAERLGILPSVCFLGRVAGPNKTWLLQNARCVCMPSREWEAFPLVILEAFAAGRPMIGTRIRGLEDLITHGRTGWLVAPESPVELAAALHEMSVDDRSLQNYGANARRLALDHGWPSIAARHVALYQSIRKPTEARLAELEVVGWAANAAAEPPLATQTAEVSRARHAAPPDGALAAIPPTRARVALREPDR